MQRPTRRRLILWVSCSVIGVALSLPWAIGAYLQRAHRREFLESLGVAPARQALASDSALDVFVHNAVSHEVPLGSDTMTVRSYARRIGALDQLNHERRDMRSPRGLKESLMLSFPERARWYEFAVCDWTRVLAFTLDSAGTIADITASRFGTCP
jgi:hypothetical protein